MDLFEVFHKTAVKYKGHAALNFADQHVTYQELLTLVMERKELLQDQGIVRPAGVAVILEDELEFIVTLFALWSLRCIPIPLDAKMNERELQAACSIAQYRITAREGRGQQETVTSMTGQAEKPPDCGIIFFTSGTTGTPKGVCFSSQAIYDNVMDAAEKMKLQNADYCYTPISVTYTAVIMTLLLPTLFAGACMVIRKTTLPRNIIRTADELKISVFYAVPYIFELICGVLEEEGFRFYCSKTVLSSSAYLEPGLFSRFMDITGMPIRTIYCSSEAGAVTYNDFENMELVRDTVGRTFANTKVRILNQGKPVSPGGIGEIYVSGTHIAAGYCGNEGAEAEVFSGGWVRTGDLAVMTEEGGIVLKGRSSDTINIAGHLVSPEEVEAVLKSYPGVRDAAVYGMRRKMTGEAAAADIVLEEGVTMVDRRDLKKYCRSKMSPYKVPCKINIVNEMEAGRYGKKIRRRREI